MSAPERIRHTEKQIARLLSDLEDELPEGVRIASVEVDLRAFSSSIGPLSVEISTEGRPVFALSETKP